MVKEINVFLCYTCSAEYDEEYEAEECCPNEAELKTEYQCEHCEDKFHVEKDAEECEEKHKDKNDLVYRTYLFEKNREVLDEASNHPDQKKLN